MLDKLKQILTAANPDYIQEYEESAMMNVKADDYARGDSFVYIEEFTKGRYVIENYRRKKITQVQIWFCKFTEIHSDASEREALRVQIENEIVLPFMAEFEKKIHNVDAWQFLTPLPRFDANEVSIMLQFEYKKNDIC